MSISLLAYPPSHQPPAKFATDRGRGGPSRTPGTVGACVKNGLPGASRRHQVATPQRLNDIVSMAQGTRPTGPAGQHEGGRSAGVDTIRRFRPPPPPAGGPTQGSGQRPVAGRGTRPPRAVTRAPHGRGNAPCVRGCGLPAALRGGARPRRQGATGGAAPRALSVSCHRGSGGTRRA